MTSRLTKRRVLLLTPFRAIIFMSDVKSMNESINGDGIDLVTKAVPLTIFQQKLIVIN